MEYDMEMNSYQTGPRRRSHPFGYGGGGGGHFDDEEGGMFERRGGPPKRRCLTDMDGPPEVLGAPPPHAFHMIQDENHQLRNKIAELEKRVSDLTATNEFLLDQNAHLRMGGKSAGNLILHFSCRFFYKVSPRTPCFVGTQPAGVHDAVNALHI